MDKTTFNSKHDRIIDRAFLFEALHTTGTVLLESSRIDDQNRHHLLFSNPLDIIAVWSLNEIPDAFGKIEEYLHNGKYCAGFVSYECGFHFETIIPSYAYKGTAPLLWFGVYDTPVILNAALLSAIEYETLSVDNAALAISRTEFQRTIEAIQRYILNGDIYQVNFTNRITFECNEDPVDLYFSLREKQHVPYSAFIRTDKNVLLSYSPELFFKRTGNSLTTKPMKGTAARGRTLDEDASQSSWLHTDEKNRSENLMIVDLLRNDLGRICVPGSVRVSDMFMVEKYETVFQMTSTVQGNLRDDVRYYDLFRALFPCGSVTGTPKIRAMQIINELEKSDRGIYCGAIGYFSPHDEAVFNVGIRTLSLTDGKGSMGVGSGIVHDSDPSAEFEEWKTKALFLLHPRREYQLLETLLWEDRYAFLEEHVARMKSSAQYFAIPFNDTYIQTRLHELEQLFQTHQQYRVRVLLSPRGIPVLEYYPLSSERRNPVIKIAPEKTDSTDPFYFHKTTYRPLYNKYSALARDENICDYIFMNEQDEVTEGTIFSLFIAINGIMMTPPVSSGVLNGIYRSHILQTRSDVRERVITINDLLSADDIFVCNSVRGMQKVSLVKNP